ASAATTGTVTDSGAATTRSLRARISRERGPGSSVWMRTARVMAMAAMTISKGVEGDGASTVAGMPLPDDLEALRARPVRRPDLDPDPLCQFEAWFDEARETGVDFAHAIALATATPDGLPSLRMVLLKEFDGGGFTFHTNLRSRKGAELDANPRA